MSISRIRGELYKNSYQADYVDFWQENKDDLFNFSGFIKGPENTPYEGGKFYLKISLSDYPYKPPQITFKTKLFHPSISYSGEINLDILRDQWSPALTIRTALISVSSLLDNIYPCEGTNSDATYLYIHDKEQFNQIARKWTLEYALD